MFANGQRYDVTARSKAPVTVVIAANIAADLAAWTRLTTLASQTDTTTETGQRHN